jgi:hypothetical protein
MTQYDGPMALTSLVGDLCQCAWSVASCDRPGDPINTIKPGPPVDPSSVVADLNPALGGFDGLHEMDIDASGDPCENDVTHLDQVWINWSDDEIVTALD